MKTESITFHGAQIPCAQDESGDVFVAIAPICEAIGLDIRKQKDRIKADETINQPMPERAVVAKDGKQRMMFCIPLKYLSGWLFSIPTNSVSADSKELLLAFKRECYDVLHAHFFKQTQASDKDRQNAALIEWIKAKQAHIIGLKKQRSMLDKAIYQEQKELIELDTDAAPGGAQLQIAFTALLNLPETGE